VSTATYSGRILDHDWLITATGGESPVAVAICRVCGATRRSLAGEGKLPLGGACDQERVDLDGPGTSGGDPD